MPAERGDTAWYRLYGVTLQSSFPFVNRLPVGEPPADVTFDCRVHPLALADLATPLTASGINSDIRVWSLGKTGDEFGVTFGDFSEFEIGSRRIAATVTEARLRFLLEIQLLGMVASLWLERRGTLTLHASAVVRDGEAIAFVGAPKAGKTSMAATFLAGGWELLTEDLLALHDAGSTVEGQPGYPQMRMWPEEAAHFTGGYEDLPVNHPSFSKRRVDIGVGGFGSFRDTSAPLRAIYVLERGCQPHDAGVHSLSPGDAVRELLRHSFLHSELVALGLHSSRLPGLAGLVRRVPVRCVRYPTGRHHLASTRALLESDRASWAT